MIAAEPTAADLMRMRRDNCLLMISPGLLIGLFPPSALKRGSTRIFATGHRFAPARTPARPPRWPGPPKQRSRFSHSPLRSLLTPPPRPGGSLEVDDGRT